MLLRADQKAGNTAAVTTDQANITADKATLQSADTQLKSDYNAAKTAAQPVLSQDKATVQSDCQELPSDYQQLGADQKAGNTSAVTADQSKIATDKQNLQPADKQLQTDKTTYLGTQAGGHAGRGFRR